MRRSSNAHTAARITALAVIAGTCALIFAAVQPVPVIRTWDRALLVSTGVAGPAPSPPAASRFRTPSTSAAGARPGATTAAPAPAAAAPAAVPDPTLFRGQRHSYETLAARLGDAASPGFRVISKRTVDGLLTVAQTFRFQGSRERATFTVSAADLAWSRGRVMEGVLVPGEDRRDFSGRLWREAIVDSHQQDLYDSLASSLRAIRDRRQLGSDEYAELIAAYVQEMPYDFVAAASRSDTKYPVATAVDGIGVCADKSLLLAGLLRHEGYSVALLDFAPESHMAVGIKVSDGGYKGTGYAFVECTSPSLMGAVGDSYGPSGRVKLVSQPHVTVIFGTGAGVTAAAEQTSYIVARERLFETGYDRYKSRLEGLSGDVVRYNAVVSKLNHCADVINLVTAHQDDREALYAWIAAQTGP